jgi:acyl carrier protein
MNIDPDIIEKTNQVFIEEFEIAPEALAPEKQIFDDLGLDSLDIVDLVVALQAKFNVNIRDDERIRKIRTLQDIYQYIVEVKK